MKIKPEQLASHTMQPLARIYLLYGDESLLVDESRDLLREAAKKQGVEEFRRFMPESNSQWEELAYELQSYSLFGQTRFIELALPSGKPGTVGSAFLSRYAKAPNSQDILVIVCGRLEAATQKSAWFKAIDAAGIVLVHWPIESKALPAWIAQRLRTQSLQAEPSALAYLASHVDGNLLAAQQEVLKLGLLYGQGKLTLKQVEEALTDHSRFSIFDCIDFALQQNFSQLMRALQSVEAEGIEPILILWNFTRELRQLIGMTQAIAMNQSIDQVIQSFRVHYQRQAIIKKQLQQASLSRWYHLLKEASVVDQMVKGQITGRVWDALRQLFFGLAGMKVNT